MTEGTSPPRSVNVLGAGTMGSGMALVFAAAGCDVVLRARRPESLERASASIRAALSVSRGHETRAATEDDVFSRIRMTCDLSALDGQAELVVETIPERLQEKTALLSQVEQLVSEDAVVVSNTSSLPLSDLARSLRRPDRFAGYHWFNPPELVRLVEIVAAPATSKRTLGLLESWSRAIGKEPVTLSREVDGFVGNRLQYALLREAYALVAAGVCAMADVDRVLVEGLGPRWAAIGPFQAMDLAGLDVHYEVARRLFPTLSNATSPPAIVAELVAGGALGAKNGRGLLGRYEEGDVLELSRRRAVVALAIARALAGGRREPGRA